MFRSDDELQDLLVAFGDGRLDVPAPAEMHDAVTARYGLAAFGSSFLELLAGVPA